MWGSNQLEDFLKIFALDILIGYFAKNSVFPCKFAFQSEYIYVKRMLKRAEGIGMRRAMTLIECMVALVILTLSASIMVMAVQGGLAAQEESLSMTLAGTAAESRIAEYLAKSYPTIVVADITEPAGTIKTPSGENFSPSYNKMSRRTVVTASNLTVPDFPGLIVQGYLFNVTVSDSWQGQTRNLVSLQRFRPWTTEEEGAVSP